MPGARVFAGNRSGAYEIHQQFAAYPGERLYGLGQRRTAGSTSRASRSTWSSATARSASRSCCRTAATACCGTARPSAGSSSPTTPPAGRPARPARSTTGSPPRHARRRSSPGTRTPPATRPSCPRGPAGSGSPSSATATRRSCWTVAREYQRRGLPLSVIVADFFHWSAMGDYRFDPAEWPDPAAMVAELRELGVELMVSVWPTCLPLSENYAEFFDQGLLVGADQGAEFQQTIQDKGMAAPMPVAFYDPTNPRTRDRVWELIERQLPGPRHPRLLAGRVRAGAQPGPPRQPGPATPAPAPKSPASTRGRTPGCSPRAWPPPGQDRRRCCCAAPPGPGRSGTARRCGPATSRPPGSRCASRSAPG